MDIEPDVIFYFPIMPMHNHRGVQRRVNNWCYDRRWLPKDSKGGSPFGWFKDIWAGTHLGHPYVALKF